MRAPRPRSTISWRLPDVEDQDRAGDRDPQDPARRRDHAGESLVRQLLRHVPGADGIPPGVCGRTRRTVSACPPSTTRPTSTTAAPTRWATRSRTSTRPDGRIRRPGRGGSRLQHAGPRLQPLHRTADHEQPALVRRRHGLPRCPRDPQLLDLRRGLRAPGPHVRAQRLVEPPRPPVHGLGAGRRSARTRWTRRPAADDVQNPNPDSTSPRTSPRPTTASSTTPGRTSPTCCTSRTSAGATTCSRAPSPTARTTPR